jgi:AhpD family alkylhydroperoxidase
MCQSWHCLLATPGRILLLRREPLGFKCKPVALLLKLNDAPQTGALGAVVVHRLFIRRYQMTQRMDYNAATPAGMKALGGVYSHILQSGLPKVLVDLVYLRVSQINGCAYCIDMHSRDLLKEGVTVEKLVLVPAWREGGALFDAAERAALAWAETVTRVAETGVPDAEYEAAAAVFGEKQLADLTIAIGLMNAYNRMAISFRAPPAAAVR